TLFVTKTDWYAKKDSGEVRASIQALSPIPQGTPGNARGFELTEFAADPGVLDQIDHDKLPCLVTFQTVVRTMQNRFGGTSNTQVLMAVVPENNQRQQPQA